MKTPSFRLQICIGMIISLIILLLSVQTIIPIELSELEAIALIAYAWSVWLLANNRLLGWWIGLIGVTLYAIVFFQVRLYAEVAIQVVYFITSLQAIYIWLRGGTHHQQRPVSHVSQKWLTITAFLATAGVFALRAVLISIRGAAPFWDALTTILSLTAHFYLMGRYIESWYLWIAVDIIYVPLYASRGLYFTSTLYAVFLAMAIHGLFNFRRIYQEQRLRFAEVEHTKP